MQVAQLEIQQSVIELVDHNLKQAIQRGASDIHWEPFSDHLRIRFRQDGLLHEYGRQALSSSQQITSRLKVLASLDIAEKRLPQDGQFSFLFENNTVDCRVSVCPTLYGEKIVIRLLNNEQQHIKIAALGMEQQQQCSFFNAIEQPQGLILITGPTGSGKTVTLYSALDHLNHIDRNISTIEDPVEIKLHGINQVSVNPKISLDFSAALRAFLRQDPDIIMIGEMRDLETAEIAIKAAQTGHLVLSTLHTNSAAESINRLLNMGIPTYQIVNCFQLIIAQRLVRKLCEHCKIAVKTPPPDLANTKIYSAKQAGCDKCHHGYLGRTAIYEMIPFSYKMKQALLTKTSFTEYLKQHAFQDLKMSGIEKVKAGITSLEEIYRITITDDS